MRLISLPEDTLPTCSSSSVSVALRATAPARAQRPCRDVRVRPACPRPWSRASSNRGCLPGPERTKPFGRRCDRSRFEMHDDCFAEDVGKAVFRNSIEIRKDAFKELQLRMPRPCLAQLSFRSVDAFRRVAVAVKPGCITTAAAPDIRRGASWDEKSSDRRAQVRWGRLQLPFAGKAGWITIVDA